MTTKTNAKAKNKTVKSSPRSTPFRKTELPQAHEEFHKIFNMPLRVDGLLSVATDEVHIDLFAFENDMKRKHPDNDWENTSIKNSIKKYYGNAGVNLVLRLL
jgi:hypothetical protein